jgi:hypothetical protein
MDLLKGLYFKQNNMPYKLSYTSLLYMDRNIDTMFGGSSKFRVYQGELIDMNALKNKRLSVFEKKQSKKQGEVKEPEIQLVKAIIKKTYRLNKSKVKKKCTAFSRLEKSKKFLAFYSISFPQGLPDENSYRIFNTWLTRCRKNCTLKSYIWVAERQKNETIHFHLLTNDFMPIKQVNDYMAKCLLTQKKKGLEMLSNVETEKYNGVDVKNVGLDKKGIINYLAKYVTKNEVEFYHLPWHCSRDISRLFTSINFNDSDENNFINELIEDDGKTEKLPEDGLNYNIQYEDYYVVAGFKFKPKENLYKDLDSVNETIYNSQN